MVEHVEHAELLAWVASMYYEDDLTQGEIARRVGTSRSTVSRILREARDEGVVEITVHYPWKTAPEIEEELVARFGLAHARVLLSQDRSYQERVRGLGVLAARYLEGLVSGWDERDAILGISWGVAVHSTVQALRPERGRPHHRLPITVVQMVGAVGEGDPLIDGPELARMLAGVYGGEYRYLHAPLIVEDAHTRDVLLAEPRIQDTLSLARQADVALVGIGAPRPAAYSLLRAGYVDQEALAGLRDQGVVGDVCARQYDAWGNVLDIELNQRVVGIDLEALHGMEQVLGVAGGEAKAGAILGALRGRHVNVLITDDAAARKVLSLG